MTNENPIADDGALLAELLDDLDTFAGMLERAHQALAKGKTEVRLIPRGKLRPVAVALDELGDAMISRTLQVRAQRAIRDGEPDAALMGALELGKE